MDAGALAGATLPPPAGVSYTHPVGVFLEEQYTLGTVIAPGTHAVLCCGASSCIVHRASCIVHCALCIVDIAIDTSRRTWWAARGANVSSAAQRGPANSVAT